jgi:hypothetical protein
MLFSESMENVAIVDFSCGRLYLAVDPLIALVGIKVKANCPDSQEFSRARNRAPESPGRAWRYALVVATERLDAH